MKVLIAAVALSGVLPCPLRAGPPVKQYQIAGVVESARDGSPVPRCRITASAVALKDAGNDRSNVGRRGPGDNFGRAGGGGHPMARGGSANPEAACDDAGRFTLSVPHAGSWLLTATARGFRSQSYDEHENFVSAVVLTDAAPNFNLHFRLQPDSVLTGLVYDEAGEQVANAVVNAELVPESNPGVSANASRPRVVGTSQTDDLGRYEIGGLAPGNYHLRVQARPWYSTSGRPASPFSTVAGTPPPPDPSLDLVFPTTWFPGVDDETAAQPIPLAPGELRQTDFHLTAIPSFHLRVPRPDHPPDTPNQNRPANRRGVGTPFDNQQGQQRPMTITREDGNQMQMVQATSNGTDWDFGGLTPGTYEVRMNGPNGRPTGEVRQIEVRASSQTVLTLDSARPTVPVTIRIEGLQDNEVTSVELVDTETGHRFVSTPQRGGRGGFGRDRGDDEDQGDDSDDFRPGGGSGRTLNVAPHTYEVYVSGMAGVYLTGMTATGAKTFGRVVTIDGAATLTLKVAKTHALVDGIATISGRPAQGAMVLLVPATLGAPGSLSAIQRDETNTDGSFLIDNVVPGRYILVVIDRGWEVKWRDPAALARYLVHGTPVDLRTTTKVHEEVAAIEP